MNMKYAAKTKAIIDKMRNKAIFVELYVLVIR